MRILFISRWFPFPPDNGSKIRIYNIIKQLSQRHKITLLSFSQDEVPEEAMNVMLQHCREVYAVPWRPYRPTRLRAILGYFVPIPRSIVDTYSAEMRELVRRTMAKEAFDLGIASQVDSAPYLSSLEGMPRLLEEVELTVLRDQYIAQRGWRRFRYGLTWWKTLHYMQRILRRFNGCTVVSEQERANVLAIAPNYKRVAVVPNGIDLDFCSGDFGIPEPDTLIFPGALTYFANFEAMRFFLGEIFPRIRRARPQAILYITGRTDGVDLSRLPLGDGVVLTGYLPDVRPRVARSAVCIAPLTLGGGTRIKILEAMALGTPVVATSKGAEGLDVTPGRDLLIADDPEAFAAAVVRVLEDAGLRQSLSAAGRRLVAERYDWRIIGQQLNAFLERIHHEDAKAHS